jgi:hypothetical protein
MLTRKIKRLYTILFMILKIKPVLSYWGTSTVSSPSWQEKTNLCLENIASYPASSNNETRRIAKVKKALLNTARILGDCGSGSIIAESYTIPQDEMECVDALSTVLTQRHVVEYVDGLLCLCVRTRRNSKVSILWCRVHKISELRN